jgi:hypothetical protein
MQDEFESRYLFIDPPVIITCYVIEEDVTKQQKTRFIPNAKT